MGRAPHGGLAQALPGINIPYDDASVFIARDQPRPIGGEGKAGYKAGMAGEQVFVRRLPIIETPENQGPIAAACCQVFSIWAESHIGYTREVAGSCHIFIAPQGGQRQRGP